MSKRTKKQLSFNKEINTLLYAFGDVAKPSSDTVKVLDDIMISYLSDLSAEAYKVALCSNRNKVKLEDFKFALRKDPIKLARLNELHALDKAHQQLMKEINYQPEKQVLELQDNDNDNEGDVEEDNDADLAESKPDAVVADANSQDSSVPEPAEPLKKKRKYTRRKPKADKPKPEASET